MVQHIFQQHRNKTLQNSDFWCSWIECPKNSYRTHVYCKVFPIWFNVRDWYAKDPHESTDRQIDQVSNKNSCQKKTAEIPKQQATCTISSHGKIETFLAILLFFVTFWGWWIWKRDPQHSGTSNIRGWKGRSRWLESSTYSDLKHDPSFGPPKGSVLEGKWDPGYFFREIREKVKSYFIEPSYIEMIQFDKHVFQMSWFNHQLAINFSYKFSGKYSYISSHGFPIMRS